MAHQFQSSAVETIYRSIPDDIRECLLLVRTSIFDIAAADDRVGTIEETLKWGEPSYLTHKPKSGTTIRLAPRIDTDSWGMFVHCQTSLINQFRDLYPDLCDYEGTRGMIFKCENSCDQEALAHCIGLALTYKLKK
ncbi:MAG: DUF1801 domain-containing protein [Cohaesibacteraceae bacterium]|nr:DUF1801 domain-containing protein [Cohaesibacteraceae bacterium]